jgi:hypothetical protein
MFTLLKKLLIIPFMRFEKEFKTLIMISRIKFNDKIKSKNIDFFSQAFFASHQPNM